jgi:nitrogen fixation/metabolism regulation signal transduction histidine kinase
MSVLTKLSDEELLLWTTFPELLGGLAHEVAQPLNAISLTCEVFSIKIQRLGLNEADAKFFQDKLSNIRNQVRRASDTVNGVRRYASWSKDSSKSDLESSFNRISSLLRQQFISRGIELSVESKGAIHYLDLDPILLDLTVAQCLVFSRNRVEWLESLHKEEGVSYSKKVEVLLHSASGEESMHIKWNLGTVVRNDGKQDVPTSSIIGLDASQALLGPFGGDLEIRTDHISLNFR